jgi:hypothetical protein
VVTDYRSQFPDPFAFSAGDQLIVEDRASEWPGWIWCTTSKGKSGWAPESYIQRDGDKGVSLHFYEAIELSVTVGEELTIIDEESGWFRCRTKEGRSGWVPKENVEPVRKT